jgi:Butirosin biosynthesis protein H, N-terminal/Domain of unknown function (DUF4872)
MNTLVSHQKGRDCATSAFRNLLDAAGLPLSEAFIFGLGEGLSFWYCDTWGGFPVLIGQNSYLEFNLCERLGVELVLHEPRTAADAARAFNKTPTVIKADCYYLDYCWRDDPDEPRQHFGEHVLLIAAIDGNDAIISDIFSDDLERVSLDAITSARSSTEGYEFLLPRNRWYEFRAPTHWGDTHELIKPAISATCVKMLAANGKFGVRGMRRAAQDLATWVHSRSAESQQDTMFALEIMARRMDEGALGNCFRGLFFEFLTESAQVLENTELAGVVQTYEVPVYAQWRGLISDLRAASRDLVLSNSSTALDSACTRLIAIANLEEEMCQCLINICRA